MKFEMELTDEMVKWAQTVARNHIPELDHDSASCELALAIVAALPNEPRDMPPGEELDALVCKAVHPGRVSHHPQNCLLAWSASQVCVGEMLDWLHEQGYHITLALIDGKARVSLNLGEFIYGETPAHALARTIAIIGEKE